MGRRLLEGCSDSISPDPRRPAGGLRSTFLVRGHLDKAPRQLTEHGDGDRGLPVEELHQVLAADGETNHMTGTGNACGSRGIGEEGKLADEIAWAPLDNRPVGDPHLDRSLLDDEQPGPRLRPLGEHIAGGTFELGSHGRNVRQCIVVERGKEWNGTQSLGSSGIHGRSVAVGFFPRSCVATTRMSAHATQERLDSVLSRVEMVFQPSRVFIGPTTLGCAPGCTK